MHHALRIALCALRSPHPVSHIMHYAYRITLHVPHITHTSCRHHSYNKHHDLLLMHPAYIKHSAYIMYQASCSCMHHAYSAHASCIAHHTPRITRATNIAHRQGGRRMQQVETLSIESKVHLHHASCLMLPASCTSHKSPTRNLHTSCLHHAYITHT